MNRKLKFDYLNFSHKVMAFNKDIYDLEIENYNKKLYINQLHNKINRLEEELKLYHILLDIPYESSEEDETDEED
jgi:hypothetical protein